MGMASAGVPVGERTVGFNLPFSNWEISKGWLVRRNSIVMAVDSDDRFRNLQTNTVAF